MSGNTSKSKTEKKFEKAVLKNAEAAVKEIMEEAERIASIKFDKNAVLTDAQAAGDKNALIAKLEDIHPYVSMKNVAGYEAAKQRFLDAPAATATDMYFAAAEFLAVFRDSHTSTVFPFEGRVKLGIESYADNDKWMLYPFGKEGEAAELCAVNGVPYRDIFEKYSSLENPNSSTWRRGAVFVPEFLDKAGIDYKDLLTLTYKKADGSMFDVAHKAQVVYSCDDRGDENDGGDGNNSAEEMNFEAGISEGVLYITARAMEDDGSLKPCVKAVKSAVKAGIKKVVLDVRGNGGGNDGLWFDIFDALGMKYSDIGFIAKHSEEYHKMQFKLVARMSDKDKEKYADEIAKLYKQLKTKNGHEVQQDFKYQSINKHGLQLKVFCNEYTGSAAMTIVSQVRYSDLGLIYGRSPGQNSNYCGNISAHILEHSKVKYYLPMTYCYYEKDGARMSGMLKPDTEVPYGKEYTDFVKWDD